MNLLNPLLIAEDDPNDRELAEEALEMANVANPLIFLKDGVEVMDYLNRTGDFKNREDVNPVAILLDVKMPRMGGVEVLEKIKGNEKFKSIPVIMLTSSKEDRDLKKCYDLGVNAYVTKPMHLDEFMEQIGRVGLFWTIDNKLPNS